MCPFFTLLSLPAGLRLHHQQKELFLHGAPGLADHCGRLTNINVGWAEKLRDTRIFRNSGLFSATRNGIFAPLVSVDTDDVDILPVTPRNQIYRFPDS